MPTFTGKTFSSFYKNLLGLNQSSNTGVDATTRVVHDGAGNSTSISLSDDVLKVQPVNDNGNTMLVKNQGGSNILAVDTTNSKVLMGASQLPPTNYAYFGIDSQEASSMIADTHYMIPFSANTMNVTTDYVIGTGTDPDLSLTISDFADGVVGAMWYVLDNITIDQVIWWSGSSSVTGNVTKTHLVSYTVDTSNGTTGGDLSSGVVVADGGDITNAGYEQAYYQSLTIQSADVDAGKAVFFIFRQDGTANHAINATVKYHIR